MPEANNISNNMVMMTATSTSTAPPTPGSEGGLGIIIGSPLSPISDAKLTPDDDLSSTSFGALATKNYWAILLLLLCVIVVFGNVLVILSVAKEKLLQNITNFFIVSLAVADLLVAGFVMPFSVYVLVNWGMWGFPEILCDFYIALDVVCSTSSIFNLVAISIDRYFAVTAPIKYSQHRDNHTRAYIFIMVCWLASIAIGSPIMLGANHIPDEAKVFTHKEQPEESGANQTSFNDRSNWTEWNSAVEPRNGTHSLGQNESQVVSMEFVCGFYNPDFIIWSSLGSFYIPCFVMIFLYARIFKALHKRALIAKLAKKKQKYPNNTRVAAPNNREKALVPGGSGSSDASSIEKCKPPHDTIVTLDKNGISVAETRLSGSQNGASAPNPAKKSNGLLLTVNSGQRRDTRKSSTESGTVMIDIRVQEPCDSQPNKPDVAHKACGPDTSIYQRSKTASLMANNNSPGDNMAAALLHPDNQDGIKQRNRLSLSLFSHNQKRASICSFFAGAESNLPSPALSQRQSTDHDEGFEPKDEASSKRSFKGMLTMKKINKGSRHNRKKKKEKTSARKEKKATQTLAIVLGCFLVCWTPFFTCNMLNAICLKFELSWLPGDTAFILTTWLGYINSCINPLIYTIFNPEFRKAFKRILGLGH